MGDERVVFEIDLVSRGGQENRRDVIAKRRQGSGGGLGNIDPINWFNETDERLTNCCTGYDRCLVSVRST
jgi:hypothetical protein